MVTDHSAYQRSRHPDHVALVAQQFIKSESSKSIERRRRGDAKMQNQREREREEDKLHYRADEQRYSEAEDGAREGKERSRR